jgi:hypothetical protein
LANYPTIDLDGVAVSGHDDTSQAVHPQHMNDLKHFVRYVCRGFENHSMWVWSLNHCIAVSFVTELAVLFQDVGQLSNSQLWAKKPKKLHWHDDISSCPSTI